MTTIFRDNAVNYNAMCKRLHIKKQPLQEETL